MRRFGEACAGRRGGGQKKMALIEDGDTTAVRWRLNDTTQRKGGGWVSKEKQRERGEGLGARADEHGAIFSPPPLLPALRATAHGPLTEERSTPLTCVHLHVSEVRLLTPCPAVSVCVCVLDLLLSSLMKRRYTYISRGDVAPRQRRWRRVLAR